MKTKHDGADQAQQLLDAEDGQVHAVRLAEALLREDEIAADVKSVQQELARLKREAIEAHYRTVLYASALKRWREQHREGK